MVEWQIVLEDHTNGFVGSEVEDVPLWIQGIADIAFISQSKNWVVVVGSECLSVDQIQCMTRGVDRLRDLDRDRCVGLFHRDLIIWFSIRKRVSRTADERGLHKFSMRQSSGS